MEKNIFTIKGVFKESCAIIRPQFWKVVAQYGAIALAGVAVSFFFRGAATIVISFSSVVMALSYANKQSFSYNELFETVTLKKVVYYILVLLLAALAVIGGFILLIVPGLIVLTMLVFVKYIVIDRDVTPRQALELSQRMTRGYRWKILGLALLVIAVNALGFICLIVGLLYTVPLTLIAFALAYKKLSAVIPPDTGTKNEYIDGVKAEGEDRIQSPQSRRIA